MVNKTAIPGKYKRVELYGEQGGPYYIKDDENSVVTYTIVDEVLQIHIGKLPPPAYLVRPTDYQVFELDPDNGAYRTMGQATYHDGTKVAANPDFTLKVLLGYGFFPIDESLVEKYMHMNNVHLEFRDWQCRPDGHGGTMGGTFMEFMEKRTTEVVDAEVARIHALILNAYEETDPKLREAKKAQLFGYTYGMAAPSLSKTLEK